jgi:hypothetical protein
MSNEPAPLLDILAEASGEAEYQAVYAKLTATDRGRNFLAEFANRNLQPDTRKLVRMIARLEAAARDNRRSEIPLAVLRGLADLAAAFDQGEARLAANSVAPLGEPLVLRHVGDIALALRKRKVEPILCDTVDAVAREVSDVIARDHAARDEVQTAVMLVQELSRRVRELIALAAAAGSEAAPPDRADPMQRNLAANESDKETDVAFPRRSLAETAESLQETAATDFTTEPLVAFTEDAAQTPAEQLSINGQDSRVGESRGTNGSEWLDDTDRESDKDAGRDHSTDASRIEAALAVIPLPELLPDREAEVGESEVGPAAEQAPGTPRAPSLSRPRDAAVKVQKTISRAAPNDPLAAVLALSEEELIALFT